MLQRVFKALGLVNADRQRDLVDSLGARGVIDLEQVRRALENIGAETHQPPQPASALPIVLLNPDDIRTDPPTYQFRSGGDTHGVTRNGRYNMEHWNPVLHGDPILVHERLDGSLFVADGHHRLDLAKRLNVKGEGPGSIAAMVLREAEGYTAQDARIIAAYKNMAHGGVDPVDGARVFKEVAAGGVHTELLPQLQMDKGNLRMSFTLSKLSDAALDRVASGEVPVEIGAKVAERVREPARQESVMRIISHTLRQSYDTPAGYTDIHTDYPVAGHMELTPDPGRFVAQLARQRAAQLAGVSR